MLNQDRDEEERKPSRMTTPMKLFAIAMLAFVLTPVAAVGQSLFEQIQKLALAGDTAAQNSLGVMHGNGDGTPIDYAEAAKWYRQAADQGNALAQSNLGAMYANGEGVPINDVIAYAWLNVASAFGSESAPGGRSIVEQRMTPGQIAEAQKLSTEIYERIQGNQ